MKLVCYVCKQQVQAITAVYSKELKDFIELCDICNKKHKEFIKMQQGNDAKDAIMMQERSKRFELPTEFKKTEFGKRL